MKRLASVLLLVLCLVMTALAQTDSVTIYDTSGSTQTNRPVSVARVFRQGEIANCARALVSGTPVTTQCDVKNRWGDGSLKFAIVSFIIPSLSGNGNVTVLFDNQGTCNNTGQLDQTAMLAGGFDFDAKIEMTGATAQSVSARTMLSAGHWRYWLQGPIVTAVILERRTAARTYDKDFGDGSKALHPIFEAWFYPQNNKVEVGYGMENCWASSTTLNSTRDLTYSFILKGGNSSVATLLSHPSFTHIGKTRWHKRYWTATPPGGIRIDYNLRYLVSTKQIPNYDTTITPDSAVEAARYTRYTTENARIDGADGNTQSLGNYSKGMNAGGAADWIGLMNTWETCWLYSMSATGYEMMLGNSDLAGRMPMFFREADTLAGTGDYFDRAYTQTTNLVSAGTPGAGSVDTYGRIISINARRTIQTANVTATTPGDAISMGAVTSDGWNTIERNHQPDVAYIPYIFSGRYWYLEQLQMQAAHNIAWKSAAWNSHFNRPGDVGFLNDTNIRGDAWGLKTIVNAASITPDDDPEKAYFIDKIQDNIAEWEGAQNLTLTYPAKQQMWNYGRNVRSVYANGTHSWYWEFPGNVPSPLGQWAPGNPAAIQDPLITTGVLTNATSPWEENFLVCVLGRARDLGVADTNRLLQFMAKKRFHINLDGTPSNLYRFIEAYRDPSQLISTGAWPQTFTQFVSAYQTTIPPYTARRLDLTADHSYSFISLAADSFLAGYIVDGLNGVSSYVSNKSTAPNQQQFINTSPKWAIVPYQAIPLRLQTAANSISAGQWKMVHAPESFGYTRALFNDTCNNSSGVGSFKDRIQWDATTKTVWFAGADAGGNLACGKIIKYVEANDLWSQPVPSIRAVLSPLGITTITHNYENSAFDPVTKRLYWRSFNSNRYWYYDTVANTWTEIATYPFAVCQASAMEWIPSMGLIVTDCGRVAKWTPGTPGSWTSLASGLAFNYSNFMQYNPVLSLVWFGGGSITQRKIYKMTVPGGVITALTDSPYDLGTMSPAGSVVTHDPVTGKFLVLTANGTFRQYDIATETWTVIGTPPFTTANGAGNIQAVPIPEYGGTLWIKNKQTEWGNGTGGGQNGTWFYKHGTPVGDSTPPVASVTAPTNNQNVFGSVTVSGSASDNVGIAGVTFKVDGVTIGSEDTSAPYSVSWDTTGVSNGAHNLVAVARDTSDNTAVSPIIAVNVVNGAQTYFVTKSGNDSNTCLQAETQGTAKLTIAAGLGCMTGGDTLKIGNGTYDESFEISAGDGLSGTMAGRTTIQAITVNGASPGVIIAPATPNENGDVLSVVDTSYIAFKGIDFDGANTTSTVIRLSGTTSNALFEDDQVHADQAAVDGYFIQDSTAQSNIIRRNKIFEVGTVSTEHGVYIRSNNNLVEDSELYSIGGYAVHVYSATSSLSGNVIRRNIMRDSLATRGGVLVGCDSSATATSNQVYNNLIYGNLNGIRFFNRGSANKAWNNTITNNTTVGILIDAAQTSSEIVNNIVYLNGTGVSNNGTLTVQSNNLTTNPLFTSSGSFDFTLTSGSPARDTGVTIGAFSTDYLQINRPVGSTWDIGAYEYVSGADTTPPSVSVTAPAGGATVSGASVSVTASASDNVGVSGVQFKLDGSNLGSEDTSAPYSTVWDTTDSLNGTHALTAVARDAATNTQTSSAVNVTVNNIPPGDSTVPSVSMTAPTSGSTVSGATVAVNANATDNVGVVGVQFKLDGSNLGSEDTSAPYGIFWDSTGAANGSHVLTATARDAAGNAATSGSVVVNVSNLSPDVSPPTVSITAPSPSTVSGLVNITAAASDDVGVLGVQFTIDGVDLNGEDVSAPYAISWNTSLVSDGTHAIRARARDAVGNSTLSSAVNVIVSNNAPTISAVTAGSITSSGASITWNTVPTGTSQVEYGTTTAYGSSTTLNESLVSSHTVSLTGLSAFTLYHFRVKSADSLGRLAVSGDSTFTTASGGGSSSITVTNPTIGTVWVYLHNATISWTSSNVTGNVRVELSRNAGATYKTIISSVAVANGSVLYNVEQPSSNSCVVRIRSNSDTAVFGTSSGTFKLVTTAP